MFDLDRLKAMARSNRHTPIVPIHATGVLPAQINVAGPGGQFKSFVFQEQQVGDCTIHANNIFRYIDYGQSDWNTDVSSTDSGDEMNITFVGVNAAYTPTDLGQGKNVLFTCYGYYFDIHDANSVKHWAETGPNIWFPPGIDAAKAWTDLAHVFLQCSC